MNLEVRKISFINEEQLAKRLESVRREKISADNRRRYFIMKLKGSHIPACQPCSFDTVSSTSATLVDWRAVKDTNAHDVVKAVCDYFGADPVSLTKKTRKREIVLVRQTAMYMLKKKTRLSLKSIGEMFGGRDHTTVIHSCQTVNNLMDTDEKYAADISYIDRQIN